MIYGYERANKPAEEGGGNPTGPPAPGEAPSAAEFFAAIANNRGT